MEKSKQRRESPANEQAKPEPKSDKERDEAERANEESIVADPEGARRHGDTKAA